VNSSLSGEGACQLRREVKPGASLELTIVLGALEKFIDRVLF
jgi:hypothetical protein